MGDPVMLKLKEIQLIEIVKLYYFGKRAPLMGDPVIR